MKNKLIIAIDGPVGSGKSTVARRVAELLGYTHLDSGAMYRAVAWKALRESVPLDSPEQLATLASRMRIDLVPRGGMQQVILDGEDITDLIRTPEVSHASSVVAVVAGVRHPLVAEQRRAGAQGGVVMEGRDIGTVVFPDAEVKIFLDAAPEVRGNRRYRQGGPVQDPVTEEAVIRELKERDARDRSRAESPLRPAPDAVVLDSTGMSLDEVLSAAEAIVHSHLQVSK